MADEYRAQSARAAVAGADSGNATDGTGSIGYDNNDLAITDDDRNHDYLGTLLGSIPWLRNDMAHGSTMLDNQSLSDIRTVAEIINQLYPIPTTSKAESSSHTFTFTL